MTPETKQKIEDALAKASNEYPVNTTLEAIREVYQGKIWIVGGFINKVAIPILHGYERDSTDLDLLLEEKMNLDSIPTLQGWTRKKTKWDNLRFSKGSEEIDIFCLPGNKNRGENQTIDDYLRLTPLTVQAVVYDIAESRLYGDIGLQALEDAVVGINNLEEITTVKREKYSLTVAIDYLTKKAKRNKFRPDYSGFCQIENS